jgi:hypothetical protein
MFCYHLFGSVPTAQSLLLSFFTNIMSLPGHGYGWIFGSNTVHWHGLMMALDQQNKSAISTDQITKTLKPNDSLLTFS